MTGLVLYTFDWVPEFPRGFVRDLRLRWALEEAGLPYRVASVPFRDRDAGHFASQPFGQVPWLTDGDLSIFESGACLLHLAEKSEALMPCDTRGRSDTLQWVIAALNSIEMVTVPWWFIGMSKPETNPIAGWMNQRFERLEAVMKDRDWIAAARFTVADIVMCDALRMPRKLGALQDYSALDDYVARACRRPAFEKAFRDQMEHFAAADAARSRP